MIWIIIGGCIIGWVQDSCEALKLIPGHPLALIYTLQKARSKFDIHRYHFLSFEVSQPAGPRARARAMRSVYLAGLRAQRARPKKAYLRMSNFDQTFCKVYIYAKGWPGIDLGA